MIPQESLLVILVKLVDGIPMPPPPPKRGRGRPKFYPDRLFLKTLLKNEKGKGRPWWPPTTFPSRLYTIYATGSASQGCIS